MNSDIYIFGKLGTSYSQCPDDFTNEIFLKMSSWYSPTNTWISIHRKGELMYYGYVRKLGTDHYIGFCSVLNGMIVTDFNVLFDLFDNIITHLAVNGEILKYDDTGNIIANTQSLVYGKPILNQVKTLLKEGLSELYINLKKLPPEAYNISASESKQFDLHLDDISTIVSASWNYSYTFISKDSGVPVPDSYQGILKRLHKEKEELEITRSSLETKIHKLEKEKKQQGVVFTLSVITFICFLTILVVNKSLNKTQNDLALSQKTQKNIQIELDYTKADFVNAKKKNEEIQSSFLSKMSEKDREIFSLQEKNEQMASDLKKLQSKLRDIRLENKNLKIKNNQYIKRQYQSSISHSETTIKATVTMNSPLRKESHPTSYIIMDIPKGEYVNVFYHEHINNYYKVRYKNTIGYLNDIFIEFE